MNNYLLRSTPKEYFKLNSGMQFAGLDIAQSTFGKCFSFLVFDAVKYERLDREGFRCEKAEDYSFTACVKVREKEPPDDKDSDLIRTA